MAYLYSSENELICHHGHDTDLCNEEVHILFHKNVGLFLKDGLDFRLAFAAQVRRRLTNTASNQRVSLVGHLPGEVTGSLIDLLALESSKGGVEQLAAHGQTNHTVSQWL